MYCLQDRTFPLYFLSILLFFVHCKQQLFNLWKRKYFFPNQDTSVGKTRNRLNFETFSDLHNLIFHVIYGSAIKQTFTYGYLPLIMSTSVPETLDFRRRGGSCKLSNVKLSKVRSNKHEHVACKPLH